MDGWFLWIIKTSSPNVNVCLLYSSQFYFLFYKIYIFFFSPEKVFFFFFIFLDF